MNSYLPASERSQSFLQAVVTAITNRSKVQFWRFMAWCFTAAAVALDEVLDGFKSDLQTIAANSRFGSRHSYIVAAKAFRYGYQLEFIDNEWVYNVPEDAPLNHIIVYAALTEVDNELTLKVAKDVGGEATVLTDQELSAFSAYMRRVKAAGISLECVSLPADLIKLYVKVYYNPMVLKADGESISEPGVFPVEAAINAYIAELNADFKGVFENDELVARIKAATGEENAFIIETHGNPGDGYEQFAEFYTAAAGHMKIDPAFPLNETITYVPASV